MKTQITDETDEIRIVVPDSVLEKIASEIKALLEKIEDSDCDENVTYSVEEVMEPSTPGTLFRGLRYREELTQAEFARNLGIKQDHGIGYEAFCSRHLEVALIGI